MPLFFWFDLFFEARAEIQKYFLSFFGSNENFKIVFRDLLTCRCVIQSVSLSKNLRSPFWRLKYLCIKLTLKTQFGLRYKIWNKRIFDASTYIATPYVCDKIFVAKSELFPVEIMLCTPPRTPRISGLKSQVLKPTILS